MSKKKTYKEELADLGVIKAFVETPAGQAIISNLKDILVRTTEQIASGYFSKSEVELKSLCATLKANLELYRSLTGVDSDIKVISELYDYYEKSDQESSEEGKEGDVH